MKRPTFALRTLAIVCTLMASFSVVSRAEARAATSAPRPADARKLACSFRHPVCVYGRKDAHGDALLALASLEHAWDVAVGPLDLPAPDADDVTHAFDVYLSKNVTSGEATFPSRRDTLARFDRASAFSLLDASLRGEALDHAAARAIFRAITYRLSPGTDEVTAESEATSLADLAVPCAHPHDSAFEAHPERALTDAWLDAPATSAAFAEGASFFYTWLDRSYAFEPGGFTRALWALTPGLSLQDATSFGGEPDTFDVLRMTFRPTNGDRDYTQLLSDFALARATDPEMPARREWDIDWPTAPRRLAPAYPVAPTGASFIVVHRRGAAPTSHLRIEATWEEHASMHWEIAKLDANGAVLGTLPIPAQHRATNAQLSIENFDGVDALLIFVVNEGDESVPFDPQDGVAEPHGYLLTVSPE